MIRKRTLVLTVSVLLSAFIGSVAVADEPLRITSFRVDATPPLGSPLCNGNVKTGDGDRLTVDGPGCRVARRE